MILIADIQRATAAEFGLALEAMREKRGPRKNAHGRQVAMLLSVRLTDHSVNRIGHFFGGRDHSTVIYACKKVEERRVRDHRLHNTLRRITLALVRP